MAKKRTVFQALDSAISGNWGSVAAPTTHTNSYDMTSKGSNVIYKTTNKDDYEQKKLELQQNRFLKERWVKANVNMSVTAFAGLNNVKLMYRDADLMDAFPEIGAALDIVSEESALADSLGSIVTVQSKSERVKSILEDLFVNRLNLQLTAQMVIRAMCKYGNQFMLLDIDHKNGVKGWKQLPVFNVERIENGIQNPYGAGASIAVNGVNIDNADLSTQFIWLDDNNSQIPFRDWQIAHFRLITNSLYLPYGVSYLNAARRHWRMLSLMEDMMLIYRLERSVERRVYKIFVGAIDDADVGAYVEQIANEFKRTPIIDPMTGQLDLRKNILPVHKDTPIPLLDGRTITIEELSKEFSEGKENYVYSIQDKTLKIVPGKVVWCGKNYTAEKLIRITLDDGSHFDLAAEHELIMRDGTKKRADEVSVGESVMPFYRKVDKDSKKLFDRYEKVFNPNSGKYEFTHRIIAETVEKENDLYNTVHHKDFNKYNNSPCNLTWVATAKSLEGNGRTNRIQKLNIHFDDFIWDSLRDNILGKKIVNRKTMLEYINGNLIDHLIEINDNKRLENNHFISREVLENRIRERGFCTITEYIKSMVKNHKIAKIETIEGDDVYCMTVVGQNGEEDRHNFAIRSLKSDGSLNDSGCFVSNCADQDLFIPVRDENAATPIDTLSAGQNMTALDDIKFVQNKVLTALRIPKSFLNFEETAGDGKNLALMDIRFTRTVNRIQQAFLMELTKVASIHLFLLGFDDELNNFTLSMKNPSTQAEQLEIETTQKKIDAVRDAVSDPGNGLPVMSTTRALRQIMKWSDKDIKENFEEIRLEKGIAAELEKTTQIIKKTGIFDTVDRIYGEPGAEYMDDQQGGMGDAQGGDMGGGGGMAPPPDMGGGDMEGDLGGDLEGLGAPGADDQGDISGQEGTVPTQDMPNESLSRVKKPLLTEGRKSLDSMFDEYLSKITESKKGLTSDTETKRVDIYDSNSLLMNEEFDKMISSLGKFVKNDNE